MIRKSKIKEEKKAQRNYENPAARRRSGDREGLRSCGDVGPWGGRQRGRGCVCHVPALRTLALSRFQHFRIPGLLVACSSTPLALFVTSVSSSVQNKQFLPIPLTLESPVLRSFLLCDLPTPPPRPPPLPQGAAMPSSLWGCRIRFSAVARRSW